MAQSQQVDGKPVTVTVERLVSTVLVTFNSLVTPPGAIDGVITAAGFKPGTGEQVSQVGQQIVIPPARTG